MAVDPDPDALAHELRPYVRALLRVMILEMNAFRAERGALGPLTESDRHTLQFGHPLAPGCCRRQRAAASSAP